MKKVSIILPVYNEAKIIRQILMSYYNEICRKFSPEIIELIVAEDGSTDGTKEILFSLHKIIPFKLISRNERKGYAKAVSDALKNCKGEWIFFSDSDGQYNPSDFWKLWIQRDRCDMVIGRKVRRRENIYRIVLSKGFHILINVLFGLKLHDADCGFRLIRKEVVQAIINDVKLLEYSFWAEFTIRACLKGFKICEVPIAHNERLYGETHIYRLSKIPKIVIRQLIGLARLYIEVKNSR